MNRKWHIMYCGEEGTDCPVADFIDGCAPRHQVKILRILGLLEEQGPILPRPYADTLHDGIHELRISLSGKQIRLLYFFCFEKFIVLYEAFIKTTGRVPEKIIDKVIDYRERLLADLTPRRLEEALGADV